VPKASHHVTVAPHRRARVPRFPRGKNAPWPRIPSWRHPSGVTRHERSCVDHRLGPVTSIVLCIRHATRRPDSSGPLNEENFCSTGLAPHRQSLNLTTHPATYGIGPNDPGTWNRPAFSLVRACVEPPAGIEPATPSVPSMRGWFTTPCSTSRAHASAQVGGPATPLLVRRGEAERGVVPGKSLARHAPIRIWKSWRSLTLRVSAHYGTA
jgi:hypothetical protein